MSRVLSWRALMVVAVIAASVWVSTTQPVRLGLDLRGGTQIVLEGRDTADVTVTDEVADRIIEVMRRRVDGLGVAESSLQKSGDRRVIVELPGVDDPDEAVAVIGRTAQLTFHPVTGVDPGTDAPPATDPAAPVADGDGARTLPDETGQLLVLGPAALTGAGVADAKAQLGETGAWSTVVDFSDGAAWAELTGAAACAPNGSPQRRVAIVLDDAIVSSPQVGTGVPCGTGIPGGSTEITGNFTDEEARDLALLVRAGALPVPVDIVEQRTIGPTLGEEAISASIQAALIGAGLTILFLIAYYRLLGVFAAAALGVYGLVAFAAMQGLGATLTLPGIAGFVLAVGMAVDGNVLVFERIKEEHQEGRSLRRAARTGFTRAWSAIADSNATTLIAAGLLFFFASGGVRGFGVTLSIGVVTSVFTALVVTRVLIELAVRPSWLTDRPQLWGMGVGAGLRDWIARRRPDVVGRRRLWFGASIAAVAIAFAGMTFQGMSYGLEFTGGRLIEYRTDQPADLDALRDDLTAAGFSSAIVQESGSGNVSVRTRQLDPAEEAVVDDLVARQVGAGDRLRDEFVGPTIGNELRNKALIAVGLALSAQLVYLAVRFRWTFATSAVVAMAHDVIIVVGVFAWLGKEVDGVFIAAVLTVVGYSVNDSVVIFDRIRERVAQLRRRPFARVANDAAMETMPRTINTGLSSLFVLAALLLLGGDTLANFSLALIVGILVGTYSSVFVATPLAVVLERRWGNARDDVEDERTEPEGDLVAVASPSAPEARGGGSDPSAAEAPSPEARTYRAPTGPIPPRPRSNRGGRGSKGRSRR